jgi:hypothetical protein
MEKRDLKILRFWNEDRSLTVMLVLLVFFIFVFVPILNLGKFGAVLLRIIYSVMLFTGILSVAKNRKHLIIVSIFAVIALLVNWLSQIAPTPAMLITHDLAAIFFNAFFAWAILVKTFRAGEITYHRIVGSIVVYLMVGLVFTYIFNAVYLYNGPSSFNNISGAGLREFLYFSFTSLTTMGYGDITPVHPLARSLANSEALIGQLYPAILIARLVSMEFDSSVKKREKNA